MKVNPTSVLVVLSGVVLIAMGASLYKVMKSSPQIREQATQSLRTELQENLKKQHGEFWLLGRHEGVSLKENWQLQLRGDVLWVEAPELESFTQNIPPDYESARSAAKTFVVQWLKEHSTDSKTPKVEIHFKNEPKSN